MQRKGRDGAKGQAPSDNRRVLRVEKVLRETISSYILTSFHHELPAMVSIPYVRASKDLRQAKVYVSIFGQRQDDSQGNDLEGDHNGDSQIKKSDEEISSQCIEILNQYSFEVQGHVGRELKMKFCPKLKFYSDELQQSALRVDQLLHENRIRTEEINSKKDSDD